VVGTPGGGTDGGRGAEASEESKFTPDPHPPVDVSASLVSDEAVGGEGGGGSSGPVGGAEPVRPRRQVDVKIIE